MRVNAIARRAAQLAAAVIALCAATRPAAAYPQFQLSTGTKRCNLCHFSPTGGGLITQYARDAVSEEISMAGNGDFLHGAWYPPERLALGIDYRGALTYKNDDVQGSRTAVFPMQLDLYARAKITKKLSFNMIGGFRGQARTTENDSTLKRLVSREHYFVLDLSDERKDYLRAGRYFAPFGLRLQDHTAYIRRYQGFGNLEETYNLTYGAISNDREYHATVFAPTPSFLGAGTRAYGATGYYEKRLRGGTAALAGQVRVALSPDDAVYTGGVIGKLWLKKAKLLVLGELDGGFQTFEAPGASGRPQLAGYLGVTYFPIKGVMVGTALEHYVSDVSIKGTERDSANLTIQLFPYAHFELIFLGKLEWQGSMFSGPDRLGMIQLHYFL